MAGVDPGREVRFADLPKLRLDELIDQLVVSARGVQRAQGRMRALLRAVDAVTGDLSIDTLESRLVEAARELVAAQHAALDVTADDDGTAGCPAGHPPMRSSLGVPIRVRGKVFGNLYLADSAKGEFTSEDEELLVALAAAAGTAISNAQLYRESQLQQRWLSASIEIASHLLRASEDDPLHLIAHRTHELADADAVSLSLLADDGDNLEVHVATGAGAEALVGQRFAPDETLGGLAIQLRRPLLRTATTAERPPVVAPILESGPVMAVPLEGSAAMRGVLTIARSRGRTPFTDADLAMAAGFAGHASVALELAAVRRNEHRLAVYEDRERIARDLHDHVIQELFAIGIGLDAIAVMGGDETAARKVHARIDDIDRTIRRIRTSIFALRGPLDVTAAGLRRQVLDIAEQLAPTLGFAPHVSFSGPVDSRTPHGLLDDVAAVVREALTTTARHAHASTASLTISVDGDELCVVVTDDGVDMPAEVRRRLVDDLRARASARGGACDLMHAGIGGLQLTWRVPLTRRHDIPSGMGDER